MGNSLLTAQDVHFTQHFSSPLILNPASTGFFRGDYRVGANHKEQWPWASEAQFLTYNTSSAFAAQWRLFGAFWAPLFAEGIVFLKIQRTDGTCRCTNL